MGRQAQRDIRRKFNCLQFAQACGSVVLTCHRSIQLEPFFFTQIKKHAIILLPLHID